MLVLVIAHRGFRVGVLENTWDAFNAAIDARVDYIELDVHLTRDGELVVIHDDTVTRTFDGDGHVGSMDWKEVATLRARGGTQHVPRLSEVLDGPRGDTGLVIELKGEGTGEAVARVLSSTPRERIVLSSRHLQELIDARRVAGDAMPQTCFNITKGRGYTLREFLACESARDLPMPFWMVSLRSSMVDDAFVDRCHALDVLAATWDFMSIPDPLARLDELGVMGIDALLLDDPLTVEHARRAGKRDSGA